MTPGQMRSFAAAHARLEARRRKAWIVDARNAIWAKPEDLKLILAEMGRE
jgi:mRNA-degrading endonuclease HigB of HigAB toxin-antitoxin module